MKTLRALALYAAIFALALTGSAFAIEPSPAPYVLVDFGYTFEPATGLVFTADGVKLPFTFEFVEVQGHDNRGNVTVQRLSPLQYATTDTAARVLKFVQGIAPEAKAEAISDYPWGPYTFTAAQRSVLVYGARLNAGLIAHSIVINGESKAAELVLIEVQRAKAEQAKESAYGAIGEGNYTEKHPRPSRRHKSKQAVYYRDLLYRAPHDHDVPTMTFAWI